MNVLRAVTPTIAEVSLTILAVGAMAQIVRGVTDTDFGRDALASLVAEVDAQNLKLVTSTGDKPIDTDFSANLSKLRQMAS